MTVREVQALLVECHLFDIDCMVRVPTREKAQLYRYLEDGATGLMIPHVSTPAEARDLVRSTRFPPVGERGFDNAGLDADFYHHDIDDYAAWAQRETFLTVQIETPLAVENVDAIAAVEGVDMLFIGPGDLGYRYRHDEHGDVDGKRLEEAYVRVAEAAARHGKAWACPASGQEAIRRRVDQGCQFVANASDFMSIRSGLAGGMAEFDGLQPPA